MTTPFLATLLRLLCLALLCGGGGALAQPPCPPPAQPLSAEQVGAGMREARDHGFLWRLRKDGHSSYLYGTVHVARREWMFPGPALREALAASDTIALEIDALDPALQQRMAHGMTEPAGSTPLPEPLRHRLARRAQAECLPSQSLASLIPEMQVASLLSLAGRRDGLDPAYGIDLFLAGWARGAHKTIVSLETPELQLNALRLGSPAETIEFVESALTEMESGRAAPGLVRIATVWADADLDALTRYESWCDCLHTAVDRAAMARMLDDRNPALADAIGALHASGKQVFAAVGSLHMIGPSGLPALLSARGFEVERIAFAR